MPVCRYSELDEVALRFSEQQTNTENLCVIICVEWTEDHFGLGFT